MENLAPIVTQMLFTATALASLVFALTEILKIAFNVPKRFIPLIAFVLGLVLGYASTQLVDITIPQALWLGGIAGLLSSGTYDMAREALRNKDETNNKGGDE